MWLDEYKRLKTPLPLERLFNSNHSRRKASTMNTMPGSTRPLR